jgi:hypothetical protein
VDLVYYPERNDIDQLSGYQCRCKVEGVSLFELIILCILARLGSPLGRKI